MRCNSALGSFAQGCLGVTCLVVAAGIFIFNLAVIFFGSSFDSRYKFFSWLWCIYFAELFSVEVVDAWVSCSVECYFV